MNYLNTASQVKYYVQLDLPLHLLLRNSVKSNVTLTKFASQPMLHTCDPHIIHYVVYYS